MYRYVCMCVYTYRAEKEDMSTHLLAQKKKKFMYESQYDDKCQKSVCRTITIRYRALIEP